MNIIKWLTKISLISLVAVSPLIYLTYLSSALMDREISRHLDPTEITAIEENTAVVKLLDANVNLAYSYTFIIGAVLVIAEILILLKQLYSIYYFITNISTILAKKRNSQMNKLFNRIFGQVEIIGEL